jgi:hypothetical protein
MPKMALHDYGTAASQPLAKAWVELGSAENKKPPHRMPDAAVYADDLNQMDQNEICTPAMKVRAAPGTTMF